MMKPVAMIAAMLAATPLLAQTPPAPPAMPDMSKPVTFVPAADVQKFIEESKARLKPGQQLTGKPLLILSPYLAMLEYRVATSYASIHPKDAEFFYVLAGGGTVVTGGALVDPKTRPDGNINGPGITGGTARHLVPGDTFIVPEGVPHIFNQFDGALVLLSMKVPHAPAQ
jgi:mannose-6-phosphate isomerase-like protein (cupin superfamily)